MKILHTADWHLGKKLDGISRMKEQIEVLDEIVDIADREAVDMVLIAGDLFDNFTPNTEAVELFYKTLKRLSNNGKRPVVAISGNHDAPNFIDAPDPLARECGIILIGHPNAAITPFELERSEEHTSELQSRPHLVCRLLLEKKKIKNKQAFDGTERKLSHRRALAQTRTVIQHPFQHGFAEIVFVE